jgi:hypothetical protein
MIYKKTFKIIFLKTILPVIGVGLFLPCFVLKAQEPRIETSYVIKLNSGANSSILNSFGDNIRERFVFTDKENFQNIFTFDSIFSLSYLKSQFFGKSVFLETNKKLAEQTITVNDPGFTTNAADIDKQWGLIKTGFPEVWSISTGSKDNIVAVVDTGIDATHEDLQSVNFVKGYNFISKQYINGNINSDDNGHGTLVAGILGATANNGIGITGTNWHISLMPLKALDEAGKGDAATISEAIVWAADNGANIINLSIGGAGFAHDAVLANSISYAFDKNTLIVAAAGNDSSATGISLDIEPVFPICDDNNKNMVLGVAAVDQNDLKPLFSNYGKNCIDVVAPGKRILSTINFDPITKKAAPNSYAYASGTSLAVPFVAGQAAILKSIYPLMSNTQIRDKIILSSTPVDYLNMSQCNGASCRGLLGAGRIDAVKSIEGGVSFDGIKENELVKTLDSGQIYQISGGRKHPVSTFVLNRKFQGTPIKTIAIEQFNSFAESSYVTPLDGTLVKLDNNPTVYMIQFGQKFPVTYQVFKQRGFSFDAVNTVSYPELSSWVMGYFLPPLDGTLIKGNYNKTTYWVVGQTLHSINNAFYVEKGLQVFSILRMPDKDMDKLPKGEPYLR